MNLMNMFARSAAGETGGIPGTLCAQFRSEFLADRGDDCGAEGFHFFLGQGSVRGPETDVEGDAFKS